ncbi:MAG: dTDP-4-dehydrorhamnose 3,5-epimerase [Thermoanaerobaculia bacterium]|nr:dTDP-4-dehydrorhamnose 3,5-epimerase [Thermoanaerobaculia bacterium]
MEIEKTSLPGVLLVKPVIHGDDRGFFVETYHSEKYAELGLEATFVQDNHSKSKKGTLRGLHGQDRRPQGKLVRCSAGEIFDVAVDTRIGAPTFGKWVGFHLSSENHHQLYIPPVYLHGFYVLSEVAEVQYKCTDVYDAEHQLTVAWDDPAIGIDWPLDGAPLLSAKDAGAAALSEVRDRLPLWSED